MGGTFRRSRVAPSEGAGGTFRRSPGGLSCPTSMRSSRDCRDAPSHVGNFKQTELAKLSQHGELTKGSGCLCR